MQGAVAEQDAFIEQAKGIKAVYGGHSERPSSPVRLATKHKMSFSKTSKSVICNRQKRDNLLRKGKDDPPRASRSVKVNFAGGTGQQHPLSVQPPAETSIDVGFSEEGDWVLVDSPRKKDDDNNDDAQTNAPVEKLETDKEKLARLR